MQRSGSASTIFWLLVIAPVIALYLWKPAWPEGIGRHAGWQIVAVVFILMMLGIGALLVRRKIRLRIVAAVAAGLLLYLFLEGIGFMLAHDLFAVVRSEGLGLQDYLWGAGFNLLFNIPAVLFFLAAGSLYALLYERRGK